MARGALKASPLIRTNFGLFLPHNLRPALISLGYTYTIYDLGFWLRVRWIYGAIPSNSTLYLLPLTPHILSDFDGHIFGFANPSIPAAELHAPFAFGRGAHADGGGDGNGECSPYPLFTVTISPRWKCLLTGGRPLLALDVNPDSVSSC